MRSLQDDELFHPKEQEEDQREAGDEETLSEMQEAYEPQRGKIVSLGRASYSGSTGVSKTSNGGSIPSARASKSKAYRGLVFDRGEFIFELFVNLAN
jgi:hypothetical protein